MLLNGHPKRFYQYTEPVVFPMDDFKDLLENKKDMIDKLFGSYCLDKDGELQETFLEDVFITNLISDLEIVSRRLSWGANTIGAIDQRYEAEDMISSLAKMKVRKNTVLKNIDLNLSKLQAVKKTASDLFLV